jgi:hypothetical protein
MLLRRLLPLLFIAVPMAAWSQEVAPALGATPLGVRQQRVERMLAEAEQKLAALKLALQSAEPERAERLQAVLNRAKELLLEKRMDETARLLDQAQLDAALAGQQAILNDLRALATLLLSEQDVRERAREEFARLGQWKTDIEKLLQAERELRQAVDQASGAANAELQKLAGQQDALTAKTGQLGGQMQAARPLNADAAGVPGEEHVGQARQSMQAAAGELRRQATTPAQRGQDQAIGALTQALSEIEGRMNELRGDAQAAIRKALAERFREMLVQQQQLTSQTAAAQQKRTAAGGTLSRSERNAVRAIGERERQVTTRRTEAGGSDTGLAGLAQQALDMIESEGSAIVLTDAVRRLKDDLIAVGNRLADELLTDARTAALQREIETSLAELIAAIDRPGAQSPSNAADSPAAASAAGGAGGQRSLVPPSAELKLLRAAQLRLNRQTTELDAARGDPSITSAASIQQQIHRLAERQAEIARLAAQLIEQQ